MLTLLSRVVVRGSDPVRLRVLADVDSRWQSVILSVRLRDTDRKRDRQRHPQTEEKHRQTETETQERRKWWVGVVVGTSKKIPNTDRGNGDKKMAPVSRPVRGPENGYHDFFLFHRRVGNFAL